MTNSIQLYWKFCLICIRSKMQYRASFVMLSVGQLLSTLMEFMGIWALFQRFHNLNGWSLPEVALLYGMVHLSFAIAEVVGRGFDTFSDMVKGGDFDRFLVRPRSAALQVAGREFDGRFGRGIQALLVGGWAIHALPIHWTIWKLLLLPATIAGGVCLFYGLFILQASLSFWTIESLEIMNTVTYGGTEAGQFPLTIYRPWFQRLFTFIIPLACVNYIPASLLLDRNTDMNTPSFILWLSPLAGVVFLLLTLQVWHLGVRRYTSTGS